MQIHWALDSSAKGLITGTIYLCLKNETLCEKGVWTPLPQIKEGLHYRNILWNTGYRSEFRLFQVNGLGWYICGKMTDMCLGQWFPNCGLRTPHKYMIRFARKKMWKFCSSDSSNILRHVQKIGCWVCCRCIGFRFVLWYWLCCKFICDFPSKGYLHVDGPSHMGVWKVKNNGTCNEEMNGKILFLGEYLHILIFFKWFVED